MLQNILKYSLWALFAVTIVLVIMFYVNVVPMADQAAQMEASTTNLILGWALGLFIVCAVVAIAFPIIEFVMQLIQKPDSVKKTIIMLVAVAAVCIVSYFAADGSMDSITETLVPTNETELKWSGAGLLALYISLAIAGLSVLFAELAKKILK